MKRFFIAFLLLLSALPSFATITRVQLVGQNFASGSQTNFSTTLGSAPTNGNLIFIVVGGDGVTNSVSTVTETGVTWTRVRAVIQANSTFTDTWQGVVGSGASATINFTMAAGCSPVVAGAEYSGLASGSDQLATNSGTAAASPIASGTTATTTQASELWFTGFTTHWTFSTADFSSAGNSSSPTNSYSIIQDLESKRASGPSTISCRVCFCEKIVSSTGTAGNSITIDNASPGSNADFTSISASIKASGAFISRFLIVH